MKSLVYADNPEAIVSVEENIRRVISIAAKMVENWTSQLEFIPLSRDGNDCKPLIFNKANFLAIIINYMRFISFWKSEFLKKKPFTYTLYFKGSIYRIRFNIHTISSMDSGMKYEFDGIDE